MTSPNLPSALTAALESKLHGLSRTDAAQRSATISQTYRGGGGSAAIRTEADALAYALARMPATYAAVAASLNTIQQQQPDFAPRTLLDIGAGPGTATWAAAEAFASLDAFTLLDSNTALRGLARDLTANDHRLAGMNYISGDAVAQLANAAPADLVIASYMINELDEHKRNTLAELAWQKTTDTLLVVEPGTPAGTQRILDLRARLIALGAHVVAPCPHDAACPLVSPDWCHFTQRLQRSRAHKQLKSADLPYEDEKFSYIALSRMQVTQRPSRVLAQPGISKIAVTAKLCTPGGIKIVSAPRRNKASYAQFKKLDWGDAHVDAIEKSVE